MNNSKEIIAFAMNMEKQGQKFYESFAQQVDNAEAKKWFEVLAETEKEHYELLETQLAQMETDGSWVNLDNFVMNSDPTLFQKRQGAEGVDATEQKYSLSDLSVLRMAYLIENDFAEYYQKAMNQVAEPEGKKILKTLFDWENEHRRVFHDAYKEAMEYNWFEQGFSPF